jgi:hypothetical protein
VLAALCLAWLVGVPRAAGDVTALDEAGSLSASESPAGDAHPLLGALLLGVSSPEAQGWGSAAGPAALAPLPHFSFGQILVSSGIVQPPGRLNRALGVPLTAHQTAVTQRAILPNRTPNAVPRTPLAAHQTAVARPAALPSQTPMAVPTAAITLQPVFTVTIPTPTPLIPPVPAP